MALAQVRTDSFLQLAKAIQGLERKSFWMSYDAEADVMYINFSSPPQAATDTEVTDDDIAIRYRADEIIGVTVTAVGSR